MASIRIPKPDDIDEILDKVIQDKITGHTRWSVIHEIVFEYEGKYYMSRYSIGATETQDEAPWEYEDYIEATEVHQVEKTVKVWEPV